MDLQSFFISLLNVVCRFEPTTEPQEMEESIEKELAK
jgi:glutathione peroxidase-family protein